MRLGQSEGFYDDYGTVTTTAAAPAPGVLPSESGDWMSNIGQIVGAYTQWDMARKLYDLNLARVQQGLEPIQAASVTPGVTVGISADVKNLVMIGIAVVAGLFIFNAIRK